MSISALSSNPLSQLLSNDFSNLRANNTTTSRSDAAAIPTDSAGGVSPFAQMYAKLESLASTDPDKFKALTSQIANQLKDAASHSSGLAAEFLNSLSSRFEKASQSGNPADLQPPEAIGAAANGQAHHHHHRHSYSANNGSSNPTDPNALFGTQPNLQNLFQNIFNEVKQA